MQRNRPVSGLGAVINVGGFDLTIDYYHIEVDDRIGATTKEPIDCLLMRKLDVTGTCVSLETPMSVNLMDDNG